MLRSLAAFPREYALLSLTLAALTACGSSDTGPDTDSDATLGGASSTEGAGGTSLSVSGGATSVGGGVSSGGTTTAQGGTPGAGGAMVGAGGATVGTGGATIGAGGATVGAGGATVGTGGATIGAGGATVSAGGATVGVGGATATAEGGGTSASGGFGQGGGTDASGGSSAVGGEAGLGGAAGAPFEYPATVDPWQPSQACVDRVNSQLAGMSLRQKAAQMIQADSAAADSGDVSELELGSILSGGGSDPSPDDSPSAWRSMVSGYESAANFGIPLLYGIDAVHGHNNVSQAVIFPHNIGLGATRNPTLLREIGRITARELRGTSIDWTFAPTIAVALDERWGRTYESYGEDPALVAELGQAMLLGLQGERLGGPESVLACAKHFAGDGATTGGENEGNVTLDEASFRTLAVEVYQPLINAGVGSIMVSFNSYQGTKMSAQSLWLTDVLKNQMGFAGFLISDWAALQQLPGGLTPTMPGQAVGPSSAQLAAAVNAGMDMIMEPYEFEDALERLAAAPTASGSENIPEERITDAARRILTIKCELGMLEAGYDPGADSALLSSIGSAEHRAVARKAVQESQVVLKNDTNLLPLSKTTRVHVAGSAADSLQKQCGGWTIDWQGLGVVGMMATPGTTTGTTILEGIEALVGAGNVTSSEDGSGVPNDATVGIVVMGEEAYAETAGDAEDLDLDTCTPDLEALQNLANSGLPVVVVLVSGRPLIIEPYLELAEAWVAAWLPGTEGEGVADVLFGDAPATGKLSVSWPRNMGQIPINLGDPDLESDPPLFGFGHGLSL